MRTQLLFRMFTMALLVSAVAPLCVAEQRAAKSEVRMQQAVPSGQVLLPKYHYGLLVFRHAPNPAAPHFTVVDPLGDRVLAQIKAEAPGAAETYPIDLAVFPDRSRFVASAATKNLNGKRSLWLLFYSIEGKLLQSERITPFQPYQLAVAADNTIWGLGVNAQTFGKKGSPEPVLYQWSERGQVLRKLLAERDFPEDSPLGEAVFRRGMTRLAVSRDRVVVLAAGSGVLAEIGIGGNVIGLYRPPRPLQKDGTPVPFGGLAVTDDGEIFATIREVQRFDRATAAWVRVEAPEALSGNHTIYGCAGNQLFISGGSGDRFHYRLVTLE